MHLLPALLPCTLCLIYHHILDGCPAAMSLSSTQMLCSPSAALYCYQVCAGTQLVLKPCCLVVSPF